MEEGNLKFWCLLTAAVIGFGYFKAWPFIRKFIRIFQGIRLNPKSTLTEVQYKKLSVGALYAFQQRGYLNTLSLDIDDKVPTILGEWWGINSPSDAKETLEYLCSKGYAYYFPYVYQAFLLEDEKEQTQIFQQNMTSQEDYDKAVEQLHNLKEVYNELVSSEVIANREDIVRYGVLGWDAGRLNFIARACFDMGYISESEAWDYIDKAYEMVYSSFSSWHDMAMSYVIGRSLWGGTGAFSSSMKLFADDLLSKPNSPWVQIKW